MEDDKFVADILGSKRSESPSSRNTFSMKTFSSGETFSIQSPSSPLMAAEGSPPTSPKSSYESMETERELESRSATTAARTQALFRYALIFINFTFIVASLLMIMAGIVARENNAVQLCDKCGELTMVSIVFGGLLWLFAMFGFNWIRQRNILLLLVYVGFLLILFLVLFGAIVTGSVFDREFEGLSENDFLNQWKAGVARNSSSNLCRLQQRYNCSGFLYGCCRGYNASSPSDPVCYGNATHPEPPSWVSEVCPFCPGAIPAVQPCTTVVYGTLRANLGGFIVINCFSLFLVMTGIAMSAMARKMNQNRG